MARGKRSLADGIADLNGRLDDVIAKLDALAKDRDAASFSIKRDDAGRH